MKKVLSIVLVAGMLFSLMSTAAYATDVSELTTGERALVVMQRADVDGDKAYTTKDVELVLKAAAGITEISNVDLYDLDLDGYISVRDAQLMLKVVTDVAPLVSEEESLEVFNLLLNDVKSTKPGFDKTATIVCPSMRITTTGAPIDKLNVTNVEYSSYVKTFVDVMNTWPYSSLLDDETKAELDAMEQSAVEAYEPQVTEKTVAPTSNSHYTYFPVNNLGWSSKLTIDDVSSVAYAVEDGCMVFTVKLGTYKYYDDEYSTGSSGFSDRQKLPYGKVFNLPALEEDDSTTLNSVQFKNGVIVLKADILTGEVISVDYSYTYVSDIVSVTESDDTTLVMKTVTTANVSENYVMNVG